MATLLIKGVSEDLLKELKRLKVELDCRTWAELLEKLVRMRRVEVVIVDEDYRRRASEGVEEFIKLRREVSRRWRGPSVLEEFRRFRRHVD
ncbi:MAG: hypothetical protein DRJ32_06360 [Thermoprotei archaeon]|nr:MAG: hypothetical protein DRJ32_06360 [Thermoprotei archaeon]